jgi:NAD/NADP transhydrogenase beta subunit|tara:strand:+ start:867 stop:1379 length:513 start_codon:yes stop_codon:yes gene_type:complete
VGERRFSLWEFVFEFTVLCSLYRASTLTLWQKMKIAFWLLSLAAMVILLACIVYCWTNRSGHTAINPLLALAFFGPVFVIGIVGRMITRGQWLSARCAEVIGFVGMAFIPFVIKFGILNQYETWIAAGMPSRNPQADFLLAGFLVGGLGGVLVIAYLITPKAQQVAAPNS